MSREDDHSMKEDSPQLQQEVFVEENGIREDKSSTHDRSPNRDNREQPLSRSRSPSVDNRSPRNRNGNRSPVRSRSRTPPRRKRSRSISSERNRSPKRRRRYSPRRSRSPRRRRHSRSHSRDRHYRDRRKPEKPVQRNTEPSKVIAVFGLSRETEDENLEQFFSQWASVEKATVITDRQTGTSKGFGFVYFPSIEEAVKAKECATNMKLQGRTLRLDYSLTKRPHSPTPGQYMGSRHQRKRSRRRTPPRDYYRRRDYDHDRYDRRYDRYDRYDDYYGRSRYY